ncbi:MAG TPA: M48 family metalloprotease [Thermoanaerobaculia bacterium]|nr:M48 family metalloprotease [Thermoanaerobaculia bacterium]
MRSRRILIAFVIAAIGAGYYFCNQQVNPVTGEKQHVALTPDQEVALGLQAAPQMAEQFGGLHPDPAVQNSVEAIGEAIIARSAARGSGYQYDFHVLRDPETVNAFALPGGQVFITAALLGRLADEAQLAGVLGHEIGHVVGRHSAEQLAKAQLTQALVGAAGVAASSDDSDGSQAAALAAVVGQLVNMRFGRKDELEADRFGVHFMGESGYDPRSLTDVMRVLADAGGGSGRPDFLSTHPDPGNRAAEIEAEIARLYPDGVPSGLTKGDPARFALLKSRL